MQQQEYQSPVVTVNIGKLIQKIIYTLTADAFNYNVKVFKYDDNAWSSPGVLGTQAGNTDIPSIALDQYDNPYVAFIDGRDAYKDKPTVMVYR